MKILLFSSLYPNVTAPRHGIFVETRLRQLLASGGVEARVMAPVPWFPSDNEIFGEYARYATIPEQEARFGVTVDHPRYPLIPKAGMTLAPLMMALACLPKLRRLIAGGENFDLIDAHYFYPDGVAAALLGKWLKKPVIITARGTDLNVIPSCALPRAQIRWAAKSAAALITVSSALKDVLTGLGVPASKVAVLRNGVDHSVFKPTERMATRALLNVRETLLLSVGNLVESKGHHLAIRALKELPGMQLAIVGSGPDGEMLKTLAIGTGVADRVSFFENVPQTQLARYYSAADALVLASEREGWPNVLLEAMACGTPVVATAVGGIPELVQTPPAGQIMPERTTEALVAAVKRLFDAGVDRDATRRYADAFSWEETSLLQKRFFSNIVAHTGTPFLLSREAVK